MTRRELLLTPAAIALKLPAQQRATFQIGCMTLPYSPFPFERALKGIAAAGHRYVGWGTTHRSEAGERVPVLAPDAPPAAAKQLAAQTRDHGLEPVMMFAGISLDGADAADAVRGHLRRIEQAAAARIPFLLTFGGTKPGGRDALVHNLRELAPAAQQAGVTVLLKQHGGDAATGRACSRVLAEVASDAVRMCYDAGNVLDYQNDDPIADIQTCWQDVHAFAIKDHRNTPKDEDCGPGFGEIDHYKLLLPLARTGRTIPLICENIFEPLVPRPAAPEGIDALARRAREFLETVARGIQA